MSAASFIARVFRGAKPDAERQEVERELAHQRAIIRQNVQAIQSGARVLGTMSGALKMMTEDTRAAPRD